MKVGSLVILIYVFFCSSVVGIVVSANEIS